MKKLIIAAAAILFATGFAFAQGGAATQPPSASDANPSAAVKKAPRAHHTSRHRMSTSPVHMKGKKKGSTAHHTQSKQAPESGGTSGGTSTPAR